jgi:acetyl esterase
MALSFKVRALFAVHRGLTAVGVLPSTKRVLKMPMTKRMGFGPGKGMLGHVPDVPTRDLSISTRDGSDIRLRVYEPEGASTPLLYLHGGGFTVGGLKSCDHVCRRLAVESHAVVVSVEYRLAPDFRFPVPLNDCEDALDWLLEQSWDTTRLVVGGDSAGGNLAAALALRMRERGTHLAGQLLIYPAVDLTVHAGARAYRGIGLTPEDCFTCAEVYLGDGDRTDPYASPLHAPDHSGLAPALVLAVGHDPLHDEAVAYASALEQAGVPTTLIDLPDHVHGSLSLPVLYTGVDEVYQQMSAFVRDPLVATAGA